MKAWRGYQTGEWMDEINVRDFILRNVKSYNGGDDFLVKPSERTIVLWEEVKKLMAEELKNGVLDIDTNTVSTITSHGPGYIDQENEVVVGLQTDAPLKRSIQPFGGNRMMEQACEAYGFKLDEGISKIFSEYRKTHNQGVLMSTQMK